MSQHAVWMTFRSMTADPSVKSQKLKPGTIKRIISYGKPYKSQITVFLITVIIEALLVVSTPLLLRELIDKGVIPKDAGLVTKLALAVGLLAVVDALFALAERDGADPVLRHAAAFGLAGCADRPAMLARLVHPVATVRLIAVVALRRQGSPAAAEFLHDADPLVVAEAARAIHDDASIPAALPALAAVLAERPAGESVLRRAINAGLRLGTAEAADRLAGYALDDKTAAPLRAEALRALKVWRNPPPLDLVDGWARRFSPEPAGGVLAPRLPALLALRDPELKTLAIEVMIAHELRPEPAAGEAVVADGSASAELRAQALRLLAVDGRGAPAAIRSLDVALREDAPAALHRAALALLLPGAPDRLTAEAPRVLARRSLPEKQHVVALLARAGTPAADALLGGLGAELAAGKLEPGLSLGGFTSQAAANDQLAALATRDVRSARVVLERPELRGLALRLPLVDDLLRPRLAEIQGALGGRPLLACR